MVRNILTLAVVALATAAVAAGEEPDRRLSQSALALESSANNADVVAQVPKQPASEAELPLPSASKDKQTDKREANTGGIAQQPSGEPQPFRPLCDDCEYHRNCLDHWCNYDTYCCNGPYCTDTPCECSHGKCCLTDDGHWVCNDGYCDVWGPPVYQSTAAVRFGWWAVSSNGSQTKTGEFQDLSSSPFWDVDLISSDGRRTLNLIMSGLDKEANNVYAQYYGPEGAAEVEFERYFRSLDHKPLTGLDLPPGNVPPATPDGNVITNDLNIGQDYAIRVEELDAKSHGKLMDNVTWRMNVWTQRKFGERQENATAHCFNFNAPAAAGATGNVCHVLSQRQTIDWNTVELKPAVEAKFDNVSVEYSHTIRSFGADDGVVSRQYTHFSGFTTANDVLGPPYDYALVPDNETNIDRVKITANLTECHKFYANLYVGNNVDEFRDMRRDFNGYDLRLISSAYDPLTITWFASRYAENTDLPPSFLTAPPLSPTPNPPTNPSYDQTSLREPIDYTRTRAGVDASWQPFGDRGPRCSNYGMWDGTTLTSGYEFYQLERDFAVYKIRPTTPGLFYQPDTATNQIEFGPSTKWSRQLDTYVRYRLQFVENPLVGISEYSTDDPDVNGTFNSNQPQQVHNVDFGYTWSPYNNFMMTAQLTIKNSWNRSEFSNFTENNYPMSYMIWYAPTDRLFFTGGYAYYSNWIDQDITLGANRGIPADTETTRWNYEGENHLVTFNVNYALSPCVHLLAGYEWDHGTDFFGVPPSPHAADGVDWSLLPSLSDVRVITHKVTTGIDWKPYHDTHVYLRYEYFDFNDAGSGLNSGTTNMVLAGATRTW